MPDTYSTGEAARLCGVSVRTVQYYDTRGLLSPSGLSEGGRRLYSNGDLERLRAICLLRELGLPISSIGDYLSRQEPSELITVLLDRQEEQLREEISRRQEQLSLLQDLRRAARSREDFSLDSVGDMAHRLQDRDKLKRLRSLVLCTAVPMGLAEWGSLLLGLLQGLWWPLAVYTLVSVPYTLWLMEFYRQRVAYICPRCHGRFVPRKRDFFLSSGNFRTRILRCPCCGQKGSCVEIYDPHERGGLPSPE